MYLKTVNIYKCFETFLPIVLHQAVIFEQRQNVYINTIHDNRIIFNRNMEFKFKTQINTQKLSLNSITDQLIIYQIGLIVKNYLLWINILECLYLILSMCKNLQWYSLI